MNFWKIINLAAWALSVYLLFVMFTDFFKVESGRKSGTKEAGELE